MFKTIANRIAKSTAKIKLYSISFMNYFRLLIELINGRTSYRNNIQKNMKITFSIRYEFANFYSFKCILKYVRNQTGYNLVISVDFSVKGPVGFCFACFLKLMRVRLMALCGNTINVIPSNFCNSFSSRKCKRGCILVSHRRQYPTE